MPRADSLAVVLTRRHARELEKSRKLREELDESIKRLQESNARLAKARELYRERLEGRRHA